MTEDNLNVKDLDYRLDPKKYITPEDGDFYLGAVDDTYLKILDKLINKDTAEGRNAAFYTESPPFDELGVHENGYFIKANLSNLSDEDLNNGIIDANNILINLNNIQGDSKNEAINAIKKDLSDQAKLHSPYEFTSRNIFVNLIGINAPSPPKMAVEQNLNKSDFEFKQMTLADAKKDTENNYVFQFQNEVEESNDTKYKFIKIGDSWHQISRDNFIEDDNTIKKMSWCVESGSNENSISQKLKEFIDEAGGEVWFVLDKENCSSDNTKSHYAKLNEYDSTIQTLQKLNRYSGTDRDGYNLMQIDSLGRYAGIAYIKKDGKWINLVKALLTTTDENYFDTSYNGNLKDKIHPKNYDQDKIEFADAYFKFLSEIDDRKKIQQDIFGKEFSNDNLNEWTVTLGDITLFIPPVNITFYSENETENLPLMRSRGNMWKQKRRTTKHLQFNIYFNEERGINGYAYKTKASSNGEEITYYLNGLRALVSQFKFIPFIPIENKYINEVLDISAVTVNNLTCENVPGYPKLIRASLTVTEFDFTVYMPEAVLNYQVEESNDKFINYFSRTFNWKTARYYYQRALIAGNKLSEKNLVFNSSQYNKELLKNRTTLAPMKFKNPYLSFYIANLDYLDEMLNQKLGALTGKRSQQIKFSDKEIDLAKDISTVYDAIQFCLDDEKFVENMKNISSNVNSVVWSSDEIIGDFINSNVSPNEEMKENIITALSIVKQKIMEINQAQGKNIIEKSIFAYEPKIHSEGSKITLAVPVTFNENLFSEDSGVNDLKNDVSKFIGADPTKILIDNKLTIPFSINLGETSESETEDNTSVYKVVKVSDSDFYLDTEEIDWRFLSYCKDISQMEKTSSDGVTSDTKMTSSVNLAQLDNLYYEKLEMADVPVENWSVSLSNHISKVNVSDLSGSSPQYLGGEDTSITVKIVTADEDVVDKLSKLPKICAEYGRRYHLILPASVIRIKSEFAQFFGIHEVLIQNVMVDTVQGQPSLKSVTITMVSNDRSLRNREALNRIEADNAGKIGGELGRTVAKSYLEINRCISKAELYPDLELPTLEELQNLGFDFVRYKFQDDRVYVDPDFYFVYIGVLSSQALRELILKSTENDLGTKTKWKDSSGAEIEVEMATRTGFNVISQNDAAKTQLENVRKAHNVAHTLTAQKLSQDAKDSIDDSTYDILEANRNIQEESRGVETWEICEDIQSLFMEKNYRQELYSYENFLNTESISKNNFSSSDTATSSSTTVTTATSTSTKIKATEGKWVSEQIENAMKVAGTKEPQKENSSSSIDESYGMIWKFLNEKSIEEIIKGSEGNKKSFQNNSGSYSTTKNYIESGVDLFFAGGIGDFLGDLGINYTDSDFQQITKEIVYAAACAATAEKEYSNKEKSENWYPANDYYGTIIGREQDASPKTLAHSTDEAVNNAVEFGIFKIKQYAPDEFSRITGENVQTVQTDTSTINATHFLIDPYYRYADIETIKAYKKNCIENPTYATVAYMRIMLYWLGKLYRNHDFPNISGDILHSVSESELQAVEKIFKMGVGTNTESLLKKNVDFFKKRRHAFDAGKMWTAAVLTSTDGNKTIRSRIENRDYRALNSYIEGVSNPTSNINSSDITTLTVRKMVLALVGQKRAKNISAEGVIQNNPGVNHERNLMEKKYIEQAEDPATYCIHACHDMVVHDARGRMLRAFPTYYMALIDEGREIGLWKLHDNFYNNMAIASMEVVKSRKIAADTAIIVMSNFYQQFSTEDEDYRKYESVNYREVFDSIFSPTDYGKRQEQKRQKPPKQSLIRLRPGARIHLRMGYGSNASMLPIVFNGMIAEVSALDTVEIVAQGDGVELLNPLNEDQEAHEIVNQDNIFWRGWFTNGGTPRQLMNAIFTTHGGNLSSIAHNYLNSDLLKNLFGRNPYGIYHFGNPDFTDITKSGESTQNIFEAVSKPAWGNDEDISRQYGEEDAPHIRRCIHKRLSKVCK